MTRFWPWCECRCAKGGPVGPGEPGEIPVVDCMWCNEGVMPLYYELVLPEPVGTYPIGTYLLSPLSSNPQNTPCDRIHYLNPLPQGPWVTLTADFGPQAALRFWANDINNNANIYAQYGLFPAQLECMQALTVSKISGPGPSTLVLEPAEEPPE